MEKYDLLPKQLLHEGIVSNDHFFAPRKLTENEILAVHTKEYWEKLHNLKLTRSEERKSGFPLSKGLVDREVTINGGTIQCAEHALKYGAALNIAGGTHHAYTDRAEGFCLLNDQAIASKYLIDNQLVNQVIIIDLDVHQGNGTAEIFKNESRVYTFSMHGEKNYPLHKEVSDLDIALPDDTKDEEYMNVLDQHLSHLLDSIEPDFIFFQSGVDVLATDKLGRLGLSMEGCKMRDEMVFREAHRRSIPIVTCMGGGYSAEIKRILNAHTNTFRVAADLYG